MSVEWVSEACTLPTAERPLRVAEFDELFRTGLVRSERLDPTRLRVRLAAVTEQTARDLTARETSCCSFFGFEYTPAGDEVVLDITVPPGRVAVLDGLAARLAR